MQAALWAGLYAARPGHKTYEQIEAFIEALIKDKTLDMELTFNVLDKAANFIEAEWSRKDDERDARLWKDNLEVVTTYADELGNEDGGISLDEIKKIYELLGEAEMMKPEKIAEQTALWEDLYAAHPGHKTNDQIEAFIEELTEDGTLDKKLVSNVLNEAATSIEAE